MHGGATPVGLANPNTKSGRYSKYLPAGLLDRYQEAEADPELLSARSEVALLQARIGDLASRLRGGASGTLWSDLRTAFSDYEAILTTNPTASGPALQRLRDLLQQGAADEDVWAELTDAVERKTKVAALEWKRLVDLHQVMTAEQVTLFTMALLDSVLRHVPEPPRRQQIAAEFHRLLAVRQPDDATQG